MADGKKKNGVGRAWGKEGCNIYGNELEPTNTGITTTGEICYKAERKICCCMTYENFSKELA